MDTRPVFRCHYRAQVKEDAQNLDALLAECQKKASEMLDEGKLMTVALYYFGRQLFLYYEPIGEAFGPECFMEALHPALSPWPQKEASCDWAMMYPVFWHVKPTDVEQWKRDPARARRRGRIAYLKHETMFEYVYHHFALTQEGLLRGDQYMTVALHEDVLFSYFEEPRSAVNQTGSEEPSKVIQAWLDVNPPTHFIPLPGCNGMDFLLLPAYFDMGM